MILQALHEYYQRKQDELPPFGFECKEIPFLIILDEYGYFKGLQDTREQKNKKLQAKTYMVPKETGRTGSNSWMVANLLWDHYGYVLGHPKSDSPKDKKMAEKQHKTFVEEIKKLADFCKTDAGVSAVYHFLNRNDFSAVFEDPLWPACAKIPGCNLGFRIAGQANGLVSDSDEVKRYIAQQASPEEDAEDEKDAGESKTGFCLISGADGEIARVHPRTPILGAKSNAKLVSFQKNMGFDSYDKVQSYNAPISKQAAFSYTTALNHLLRRDSAQRMQIGDASTTFWAEKQNSLADDFSFFFTEPPKDDPDRCSNAVKSLLNAPITGAADFDGDSTRFYVLGLAPNAARIAVRFWHVATVNQLASHIRQHFLDLEITQPPEAKPYLPLRDLLKAVAPPSRTNPWGDTEKLPPSLAGEWIKTILDDSPYPYTLLQAGIIRIRAEQARKDDRTGKPLQNVTYQRAALLKAWINRNTRLTNPDAQEEIKVTLDKNNTNTAYRLGRLFAALERIQQDAFGGPNKINSTVRDRYYGAGSSTPAAVFPTLVRLSQHHLSTLRKEKPGLFVKRDKLVSEIMNEGLDGQLGFPSTLPLADQGRFAIGYYHQRQDFFAKNEGENA
jgi:CRISPR-associated protein Csd1